MSSKMAFCSRRGASVALLCPLLMSTGALAQSPLTVKFEVASVKLAAGDKDPHSYMQGGPGTADPERIVYERQSFARLLCAGYGIDFDQISGPSWIGKEFYTVVAKLPPGSTSEDLKLMWQDLLGERFHLKVHMDRREFQVYELSIARDGPRLQKSGDGAARQEPGFPVPRPGEKWAAATVPPRNLRQSFRDSTMAELVQQLRWPLMTVSESYGVALGRVVDKTGLDAHYDFTLEFAGGRGPGGAFPPPLPDGQMDTAPTLLDALRQQLGLVLTQKKEPLDVVVIDHVDRTPTDN